jgi:hypothetical protein
VDRLVALGILSADRAGATLLALDTWTTLDEEIEPEEIPFILAQIELAVQVHGEDVDDLEESYREILERAAALSGGSVVVSGVALDMSASMEKPLTFRRNDEPASWWEEHTAGDYLDQMAVMEQIADLAPGGDDPRRFYGILGSEPCDDDYYLLLTEEQARALREEFGLDLQAV